MRTITRRVLHLMMGLYLAASAIVLADDVRPGGGDSALASAAETIRESSSGSGSSDLVEGVDSALEAIRRLAGAFYDASTALD